MKIENWKLEKIKPYFQNAKKHNVEWIAESIKNFKPDQPIVVDGAGVIIKGHGRLKAAKHLGMTEFPVVVRTDLTAEQVRLSRIADNRSGEGGWDADMLALELGDIDMGDIDFDIESMGIDQDWFDELGVEFESDDGGGGGLTDDDAVPEVPEEPVTKLGDLYLLGGHRLLCGDSTDAGTVERMMDGERADMVFTDPPYGMGLDTDYSKMPSTKAEGNKNYKKIIGDNEDFKPELIQTIFKNFDYCKEMFLWGADYYSEFLQNKNSGSWVVWDKRVTENFDKMIGSGFELCWSKAKHKRMLARINNTLFSGDTDARNKVHPSQKPIKLVEWVFDYWSIKGKNNIIDLYLGSGSTLIACEKTNRKCYGMELDPAYCDVIVKRWEEYTGKTAELIK